MKITRNKISIMAHVVYGYKSVAQTESVMKALSNAGVSYIEIQIPFTDPIADGPIITQASREVIRNGFKVNDVFNFIRNLKGIKPKILIMTYYNIIFNFGVVAFCKVCQDAGVYGIIVPDYTIDSEHVEHLIKECRLHKIHFIHTISPNTSNDRLKKIAAIATGLVYVIARTGITGNKTNFNANTSKYLANIKKYIMVPKAVGFGVQSREQVNLISKHANIAVVGSAIVELIRDSKNNIAPSKVRSFMQNLIN